MHCKNAMEGRQEQKFNSFGIQRPYLIDKTKGSLSLLSAQQFSSNIVAPLKKIIRRLPNSFFFFALRHIYFDHNSIGLASGGRAWFSNSV
jgi:hypothetical protein